MTATLTSPLPVSDQLAGLLVAHSIRGVVLFLDADGEPRAKALPGEVLTAEARELLTAHREAIVAQLYEDRLWTLGRQAQAGDADALAAFLSLLARYEAL